MNDIVEGEMYAPERELDGFEWSPGQGNLCIKIRFSTVWKFLKKLKTELPYDSSNPTLGHIPGKKP